MVPPSESQPDQDLPADERRAETLLPLRPTDLQVLLVLGDGPLHPYGIAKAAESAGGRVTLEIGSLYRTLNRLRTQGLIEPAEVVDRGPQGQERRTWRITSFGVAVARAETERLREVLAAAASRRLLRDPSA
jgi:DNA-binding PadR family transcriptional regulator